MTINVEEEFERELINEHKAEELHQWTEENKEQLTKDFLEDNEDFNDFCIQEYKRMEGE